MGALIGFFESIGNMLSSVFGFVIGLIEDLVYMVTLLGKFIVSIPSYLAWLPAPVVIIIVSIFGVVLIYKILGREG